MAEATQTTVLDLPLGQIGESDGINPRRDVGDVGPLAASIKDRGVLQPIRVRAAGTHEGEIVYVLVAGKRRLAAAKLAGLDTIPAVIAADGDGDALDALIENVQREDLSPLEEAHALDRVRAALPGKQRSGKQLAKIIRRSDDWVSDRLRLLTLPDKTAAAIDTGEIGLHAMPGLARIAERKPELADAIAAAAAAGDVDRRDLEDPAGLAGAVAGVVETEPPAGVYQLGRGFSAPTLKDLPIEQAVKDELSDAYKALPDPYGYPGRKAEPRKVALGDDDAAAARAFGCLLEIERPARFGGGKDVDRYITDPEFLADRVRLWVERETKKAAQTAKSRAKDEKAAAELKDAQKDRETQERERRKQQAADAIAVNEDLARLVPDKLAKVKPDDLVVTLLATAVIEGIGAENLAARGLRYVHPALADVDHAKSTAKYADPETAAAVLRKQLDDADGPAQTAAVAVRALVLAHFADTGANPGHWWKLPGEDGVYPQTAALPALIELVANTHGALTPRLAEISTNMAKARENARNDAETRARRLEEAADRYVLAAAINLPDDERTTAAITKAVTTYNGLDGLRVGAGHEWLRAQDATAAIDRLRERELIELVDGNWYVHAAGRKQHQADRQWWRDHREQISREQILEDYGDLDSYDAEERADVEAEINAALDADRARWAEEDAEDERRDAATIVHVKPTGKNAGDPVEAELQPDRQNGRPNVRKVIYTESRTAAWVAADRIIDLPDTEEAAAA